MPGRSKGRNQTKCSFWSSRFGVGRGAKDTTTEKFTVTKPWRRPRPAEGYNASEEEDLFSETLK
jgi:hypothetical protein